MNATPPKRTGRPVLWTLAAIVVVLLSVAAYIVFGPHPTDFAGGKRVALCGIRTGKSRRRAGGTQFRKPG